MKKLININFHGRVIPIEETAYELLKQYIESLRLHFVNEEGRDEIINDIESRIAELFGETLKKGATCITDDDVNNIIASIGRPQDFETEDNFGSQQKKAEDTTGYATFSGTDRKLYRDENHKVLGGVCGGIARYTNVDSMIIRILAIVFCGFTIIPYIILWVAIPGTSAVIIGSQRKRLYRDPENKIIAGVCGGLSQYFGVNLWIPRLLFLLPFLSVALHFSHDDDWWGPTDFFNFSFSPGAIFVYLILWLILPEAKTTTERLEMKGEKVDINSIRSTIQGDLVGFQDRAQDWGKEVSEKAGEMGKTFSKDAGLATRRGSRGLGDVLGIIIKFFAYFVIGIVLFALTVGLFAAAVGLSAATPATAFIIADGQETWLLWAALVLFVWVPVLGLVTFILRRLMGRPQSRILSYTFWSLWVIGLVCVITLAAFIKEDYKMKSNLSEEVIPVTDSNLNSLVINMGDVPGAFRKYRHTHGFSDVFNGDSVYLLNTSYSIIPSPDNHYHITYLKSANSYSVKKANELAALNRISSTQSDSVVSIYSYVAINRREKFRNQQTEIVVSVPQGKRIRINSLKDHRRSVHINAFVGDGFNINFDDDQDGQDFSYDEDYVMTKDGLEEITTHRTHTYHSRHSSYDADEIDEAREAQEDIMQRQQEIKDEIRQKQQEIKDEIRQKQQEIKDEMLEKKLEMEEQQRRLKELEDELQREKSKPQKIKV